MNRSYTVEFKRDLRPESGLHWRLACRGNGHWCVGAGFSRHASRALAEAYGQCWLATGLDTSTPLNHAKACGWAIAVFARDAMGEARHSVFGKAA
jgi:hypothetical protein